MKGLSQKEIAHHMVSRGERFVLYLGLCVWGPVFFIGMTAFLYFWHRHDPAPLHGAFLAYFLLSELVICEVLGFLVGLTNWRRYSRLAKGWQA
jgi:hypothetical protein